MGVKEILEDLDGTTALRIEQFPNRLHAKIKRYIDKAAYKQKRTLNKQTATIEIVEKALSKIKLD